MADVVSCWIVAVIGLGGGITIAAAGRGRIVLIVVGVIGRTILVFLILVVKQCSSQETCSPRQIVAKLPRLESISQHKVSAIELVQRVLNVCLWDDRRNR